jgi:hypothetical protein
MATGSVTTNGQRTKDAVVAVAPIDEEERELRLRARKHIETVRSFKQHVATFVVAMVVLGGIWVLTEYQNADGWPDRFSDSNGPGTWNPWFFWVALVWGGILAYQGVKTYFQRPPTEAELRREIERLKGR